MREWPVPPRRSTVPDRAPAKAGALCRRAIRSLNAPASAGARDGGATWPGGVSACWPAADPADSVRPNAKRGRCCHRPRLRFRPGSLDPGRFPIGYCGSKLQQDPIRDHQSKLRSSLQASTGQAPFRPVGRLSGEPATILRTSFRQAGDHSLDILPASRRLSVRLFSTRRTWLSDRPFLSGRTLRGRCGLPSSKLSGRPFAIPSPEGSGFAGLRKSGFGLRFPRCLALLPGCPTRASLASFPKDIGPLGTGGVLEVPSRCRAGLLDREMPIWPSRPICTKGIGPCCLWITWITGTSRLN